MFNFIGFLTTKFILEIFSGIISSDNFIFRIIFEIKLF